MSRDKVLISQTGVRYFPGAILVQFKHGTSKERIVEIVKNRKCKFQDGFDGHTPSNILIITKGKDEECVSYFLELPEVETASLNEELVTSL